MSNSGRTGWKLIVALVALVAMSGVLLARQGGTQPKEPAAASKPRPRVTNIVANPYRMVENWPQLGNIKPGAAIGHIPDGKGGLWLQHRSEPPILKIDASGKVTKSFGNGMFVQAHGLCMDRDGNIWAGDSGTFGDDAASKGRGYQYFKFNQDGKLLLTIGKPGVSKRGPDTFVSPCNCALAPNGNIVIADGHIPRPSWSQQDGDRIVEFTTDGKFVREFGQKGTGVGEFWGPHAVAFDSQGRLFVADQSNNRIQVFDKDYKFLDDWKQFGRPSGVWILKDDTLLVADSESGYLGFIATEEKQFVAPRNAGWKNGVRVGSARDGSFRYFIANTNPEGLSADEMGNIFAGLTGGCDLNSAGNCLQKWVRQGSGSQ